MATPNGGISGTLGTDLEGHWSFDNGSLLDSSGNSRNLTKIGNPIVSTDKDGLINNAYDGLDIDNQFYFDDTMDTILFNSDISCSIWTNNKNNSAGFHDLFITNEVEINGLGYGFFIARESEKIAYGTNANFTIVDVQNGWNNIIVTYNKTTYVWKCYINGVYISQQTHIIQFAPRIWQIGGGFNTSGETALIDEIRLSSRVYTDAEVLEIFEMGVNYYLQAETPAASIQSGSYTETQFVELSSNTIAAEIYYTLNGEDPDDTDTLYTTAIEISENTILKAITYANNFSPSNILTEIYNIEGGNLQMNESQSAGLLALFWKPTESSTETVLGEIPLDGATELSMQEVVNFYNTKYAGNHPTEARVTAGASTFTVDLIESPTLRALLSNTSVTEGTKTVVGMNTGKRAITGQLRLHPMYNGSDLSEDVFLLKCTPQMTDVRVSATENGKKLIKVVFTVMGVKTDLATPAVTDFAAPGTGTISYKMLNANDLGTSAASAAETGAATGDLTFTPGTGTNRVIFYKSTDAYATFGATSYYEVSAAEFAAKSFATGTVTWIALTSAAQLAAIPAAATGYYYKAIEIGV